MDTYPQAYAHHCRIQEIGPQNADKLFLACGSLLHRGIQARGNIPTIISNDFGAKFANIDYPAAEYNSKKITKEILIYIYYNKRTFVRLS